MTADARPPFTPVPADLRTKIGPLADRPRLFPSRLGPGRPHLRHGNMATGEAGRIWLLSRLWVQHADLEYRVAKEAARPRPNAETLGALKRAKLAIRDRIASLDRRA